MTVDVLDINGASTGRSVELPDEMFAIEPNDHAIYLAAKQYQAHQRQGTHKAKERGEIVGSTRKIKRQKGTGTARAGSIKNPLFRGGGRIFGPRPRKYSIDLNKKVKRIARNSALSYKVKEEALTVVEDFNFETPKTKEFVNILDALGCGNQKVLLVTDRESDNSVYLSSRNLQKVKVVPSNSLNVYSILNANKLIISEKALEQFTANN